MGEPGVGKPRLTRITAMLFSGYHGGDGNFRTAEDFDVFRGLQNNSTPARYDDGDVSLEPKRKMHFLMSATTRVSSRRGGQLQSRPRPLRIITGSSYADLEVANPEATSISHDGFVKMIGPAIGHIPSADTRAIHKRSVFIERLHVLGG